MGQDVGLPDARVEGTGEGAFPRLAARAGSGLDPRGLPLVLVAVARRNRVVRHRAVRTALALQCGFDLVDRADPDGGLHRARTT